MKKPREPEKPWPPTRPWWLSDEGLQVREQVGPVWEDEEGFSIDEPYYPDVTIESIEKWAEENGVDPRTVTVTWHPGSHVYEMMYEAQKPITQEMRDEAEAEYQADLKVYEEETLPKYEADQEQYETDLRAYYKWQHDRVGQRGR